MTRFRQLLLRHFWWIGMSVAALLLIAHSLRVTALTVDSTSLFLLGIMLLCPWLAALKRIKLGDFESEIDPAEVKRLTTDVSKALPHLQQKTGTAPPLVSPIDAIKELASTDPVIALAKLRIELERTLRRLHSRARRSAPGHRTAPR